MKYGEQQRGATDGLQRRKLGTQMHHAKTPEAVQLGAQSEVTPSNQRPAKIQQKLTEEVEAASWNSWLCFLFMEEFPTAGFHFPFPTQAFLYYGINNSNLGWK